MSHLLIEIRANGPYLIQGPLTFTDSEGQTQRLEKPAIALCRCGKSTKKPFCDGAHAGAGFEAPGGSLDPA